MKLIPLTKGYSAMVDDEDYDLVAPYKWHVKISKKKHCVTKYAQRTSYEGGVKRNIRMHVFVTGIKGMDHIDGDGLNNQRSNLRISTTSQNNHAIRRPHNRGWRGVFPRAGGFRAQIKQNYTVTVLGQFKRAHNAALAYNFAAEQMYGEFANFNLPDVFTSH